MSTIHITKTSQKVLLIILIVALGFILVWYGEAHFNPFSTVLYVEDPIDMACCENGSVIVDDSRARILFTDSDDTIVSIVNLIQSDISVDYCSSVFISGDTVYARCTSQSHGGVYLVAESIEAFDFRGNHKRTVYSRDYGDDDFVCASTFNRFLKKDGELFLIVTEDTTVAILSLSESGCGRELIRFTLPEHIFETELEASGDEILCLGRNLTVYRCNYRNGSVVPLSGEEAADSLNRFYRYESLENVHPDYSVSYPLIIKNALFFLSLAYVAVFILALLIRFVRQGLIEKHAKEITAVLVLAVVVVFFSYNSYNQIKSRYYEQLVTMSRQLAIIFSSSWNDEDDNILQRDPEKASELLAEVCKVQGKEVSMYVFVETLPEEGVLYTYADSLNMYPAGVYSEPDDEEELFDEVYEQSYRTASCAYSSSAITDRSGETTAYLTVGLIVGNLQKTQRENAVNLFVNLLAIMIAIYLSMNLSVLFKGNLRTFRQAKAQKIQGAEAVLAGFYNFTFYAARSVDTIIQIYAIRKICSGMDSLQIAAMAAVPITAQSIGGWIGALMCTYLLRKTGERKIGVTASIMACVSMVIMAYAVTMEELYLFTVCKFIYGAAVKGAISLIVANIPYKTTDETLKKEALFSLLKSSVGAQVLSVLTGAYLAQYLSYAATYLFGAVLCVALLFLTLIVCSRGEKMHNNRGKVLSGHGKIMKIRDFLKPYLLSLFFLYNIPTMLCEGYSTYIFPLLSAESGISEVLLSNLSLFSMSIVFLLSDWLKKLTGHFGFKKMLVLPALVMGGALLVFAISPGFVWAVVILPLTEIMYYIKMTFMPAYYGDLVEERGFDSKYARVKATPVLSFTQTFKSAILGVMLGMGYNACCIVLGLITSVFVGIFAAARDRIKPEKATP